MRRSVLNRSTGKWSTAVRAIQTVAASVERVVRNKAVRIGRRLIVTAAVLVHRQFAFRKLREVLFQMHRFEGLAKRKLFGMTDVKVLAEIDDGSERFDGEINAAVQIAQIRQLKDFKKTIQ